MIAHFLPYHGSVLLYGRPSQFQSVVASDLACCVALNAGPVVYLVTDHAEANTVTERVVAWRTARQVEVGKRLRVEAVRIHGLTGRALLNRVHEVCRDPRLVIRDLSMRLQGFDGGDPWLADATALAAALRCAVLTVAHAGPLGALDMHSIAADEVWHCATFHHKERQSNTNIRLTRERPLTADKPTELHGSDHRAMIVFDPADAEEPCREAQAYPAR
jgi:hypothetical protein